MALDRADISLVVASAPATSVSDGVSVTLKASLPKSSVSACCAVEYAESASVSSFVKVWPLSPALLL